MRKSLRLNRPPPGCGSLLELAGVGVAAQPYLEVGNLLGPHALRPEKLVRLRARVEPADPGHVGRRLELGRQAQMLVAALLQDVAGQVVLVHALHHDDAGARGGIVQAGGHDLVPPHERGRADRVAVRLLDVVRVVTDQHVCTLACGGPANRRR
jgi:hypothetical protein